MGPDVIRAGRGPQECPQAAPPPLPPVPLSGSHQGLLSPLAFNPSPHFTPEMVYSAFPSLKKNRFCCQNTNKLFCTSYGTQNSFKGEKTKFLQCSEDE